MIAFRSTLTALIFLFATAAAGQVWETHGPYGGSFEAIAFAPTAPGAVYGGNRSGIFRSDDHGLTWRDTGCELGDTIVSGLAVVPQYVEPPPPPVVFAATAAGLFRSVDGGAHWSPRLTLSDDGFASVAVDPGDPGRIYAGAAHRGLFRSVDGGETWDAASPALCSGDPNAGVSSILVLQDAVLAASSCGVYRTADGGDSWTLVTTNPASRQAVSVAGAFSSHSALASFFADSIVASGDSGVHWAPTGAGLPSPPDLQTILSVDPRHPAFVYAGEWSSGIFRSIDGGVHWSATGAGLSNPRILSLAVDPFSSAVLAGTGDRLDRSDDGGSSWQASDAGLRGTSFVSVAVAAGRVYAGAFERGDAIFPAVFASTDAAQSWQLRSTLEFLDPLGSVYAPGERPGLVYATSAQTNRAFRSRDGGATWTPLDAALPPAVTACGMDFGCALNLAVADDGILYAGGSGAIFRSADDGDSWEELALPEPAGLAGVDPLDSSHVYAATVETTEEPGSHFLVSEDGGGTWRTAATTPHAIFSLTVDRRAPRGSLYALEGGNARLIWSEDDGAHWTEAAADLSELGPRKVIADAGTLYVPSRAEVSGASAGVYRSRDRGEHWERFGDCLASSDVADLTLGADGKSLYAATNGGVFRIAIERPTRRVVPVPPSPPSRTVRREPS